MTEAEKERERESKKITSSVPYWFEPFTIYHSTSWRKKTPFQTLQGIRLVCIVVAVVEVVAALVAVAVVLVVVLILC